MTAKYKNNGVRKNAVELFHCSTPTRHYNPKDHCQYLPQLLYGDIPFNKCLRLPLLPKYAMYVCNCSVRGFELHSVMVGFETRPMSPISVIKCQYNDNR